MHANKNMNTSMETDTLKAMPQCSVTSNPKFGFGIKWESELRDKLTKRANIKEHHCTDPVKIGGSMEIACHRNRLQQKLLNEGGGKCTAAGLPPQHRDTHRDTHRDMLTVQS